MLRKFKFGLLGSLLFAGFAAFAQCPGALTTVTVAINEDATITTSTITCARPGINTGPNDALMANGRLVTNDCIYTAYFQVTTLLSSIPANAVITAATLSLTVNSLSPASASQTLEVVSYPWTEGTITGSNAPAAVPATSAFPADVVQSVSSGLNTFNVLSQIKFMVGSQFNNGWMISFTTPTSTGNVVYKSSEHATVADRPKLSISYYLPIQPAASVTHVTSAGATDGAIDLSIVSGGSGNFSYQWYDYAGPISGATTQDISGRDSGVYRFRITDNCSGGEVYYGYVMIGIYCTEVTFNLKTDPDWGFDSYIHDGGIVLSTVMNVGANTNFGTNTSLVNQYNLSSGIYNSLLWFRYFGITPDDNISAGQLKMFANGTHSFNDLTLKRITQSWNEQYLTWVTQPAVSTTDAISTTAYTVTPNASVNVLPFLLNFQLGGPNYGFMSHLTSPSGSGTKKITFFSSDYTTDITKRPYLQISFTAACPAYAHLRVKPDGYSYEVKKILTFYHNEEYEDPDVTNQLIYKIYRISDNKLMNGDFNYPLPLKYGDNRYFIPLADLPVALAVGDYMLEVTNQKKEKTFLKFKVII